MTKIKKAGLLIGLLASPALIFLYLINFTTNHYDLPYFFPLKDENTGEYQLDGKDSVYYQIDPLLLYSKLSATECKVKLISIIPEECKESCQRQIVNFMTVKDVMAEFTDNCFNVYYSENLSSEIEGSIATLKTQVDSTQRVSLINNLKLNSEEANTANTVLLDKQGRIRGFFRIQENKELERLLAEIKVLNHNLKNLE